MDLIKSNLEWILSNPWAFMSFSVLFIGSGFGFANLIYRERIEILREKLNSKDRSTLHKNTKENFTYNEYGRFGRNILFRDTHSAKVEEALSFSALIPEENKLLIILRDVQPKGEGQEIGGWCFNTIGIENWIPDQYQEQDDIAVQRFKAEAGHADLEFSFLRTGRFAIEAYEGDAKTVSWMQEITVTM